MSERLFPIMFGGYRVDERISAIRAEGGTTAIVAVPWSLLEPHERQAQRNHNQTLRCLAERGGLSACEAVAIIEDRPYRSMSEGASNATLARYLAAHLAA